MPIFARHHLQALSLNAETKPAIFNTEPTCPNFLIRHLTYPVEAGLLPPKPVSFSVRNYSRFLAVKVDP
jgi:hypothetical protein